MISAVEETALARGFPPEQVRKDCTGPRDGSTDGDRFYLTTRSSIRAPVRPALALRGDRGGCHRALSAHARKEVAS